LPKDKTESRKEVLKAARSEFLEKGFANASIRSIGKKAGMTSAGLYRHCKDKEDLFCLVMQPLMDKINSLMNKHKAVSENAFKSEGSPLELFEGNDLEVIAELAKDFGPELKLLLTGSSGTRYENYLHDIVHEQQKSIMKSIKKMKELGYKPMDVTSKELHIFLSAYLTAATEPLIHDYSEKELNACLKKTSDFFMPAWKHLMGII